MTQCEKELTINRKNDRVTKYMQTASKKRPKKPPYLSDAFLKSHIGYLFLSPVFAWRYPVSMFYASTNRSPGAGKTKYGVVTESKRSNTSEVQVTATSSVIAICNHYCCNAKNILILKKGIFLLFFFLFLVILVTMRIYNIAYDYIISVNGAYQLRMTYIIEMYR